ncbi:MAG: SusC/RagA family TonB-linked outer membrane protein, partial [Flavisolibacter sp.]
MRKLKPKLTTLVVTLLLFVFHSVAQTRVVTGTVTDQNGKGIPGVTVSIKGTTTATQTDASGTYRINAPESGTLVFTSVGYGTIEQPIGSENSVDATLTATNSNLDEVVVIGYGTARKRDLTGSVATVNEKDFNKGTFVSPDQLIQGKVAGVVIVQNNGAPGAAATIKIRGNSAVTGSGNPLFVVDGVPLDGRSPKPGGRDVGVGGSPASNPLSFLNPADIASIDVLKDASATAIYGSRAAYGVVLITTKKGKSGQPSIDFGASYGVSTVMKRIDVLDAQQFREALTYYGLSNANDKGSSVDAFDEITRSAPVQNYNLGLSGGTENARYRFSLGALNQQGVVKKSGIKKYTANLSTQFKFLPNKNFGLDVNILPSHYSEDMAPITNNAGSRGSLIGNALQWNPTENLIVKKANGEDSLNVVRGGDLINPLALQEAYDDNSKVTQVLASISPYFKFTNWLEYRFLYSINYSSGTRRTTVQPWFNIPDILDKGFARIGGTELMTQQMTHTLNLNRDIAPDLHLNALLGFEYMDFKNKGYDMGGF